MGAKHVLGRVGVDRGRPAASSDPGRLGRQLLARRSRARGGCESASTSQVRAAPATTPTMRSHQLNSALIGCRRETRVDGASRPRIADTARHRGRAYTPRDAPDHDPRGARPAAGADRVTPDPIAFQLGPIPVSWYGICYAVGLAAAYLVITREARRRGLDARLVDNGIIIVAVAALDRRPAVPRHRPVGAVQGRPAQDRPAAVLGPRRLRRDHHRHDRRLVRHPALEAVVLRSGRTSSRPACS